jgi:hypothetical protein
VNPFYFYADQATLDTLKNAQQKVILVGSDSGNSNFGDILQLKGTINFYKDESHFVPIPVFNLFNISDCNYVNIMKKRLGVDGLIFVSDKLIDFEDSNLELVLVDNIMNCDLCHLYGGGFLNSMWGEYVLAMSESILKLFQISNYVISGQQVEDSFAEQVKKHVSCFKPTLVGARDHDSLANLINAGVESIYTFDDATEELLKIADKIPAQKTQKVLGHINLSSYTNSRENQTTIAQNFATLKTSLPDHRMVLFNAFNNNHYVVTDTLGTLVEMENNFPYKSYSVVDGPALAYYGIVDDISLLAAEIAISSSYHTTLLMHLSGTPCWLVSNNNYYDQKRSSLGVSGTLEEFLSNPTIPDYTQKLEARKQWQEMLLNTISKIGTSNQIIHITNDTEKAQQKFFFRTNGIIEKDIQITHIQEQKAWVEDQYKSSIHQLHEQELHIKEWEQKKNEDEIFKKSFRYRILKKMKIVP